MRTTMVEAGRALFERPGRALLVATGTVLGTGVLVATLGTATTLRNQVSSAFDRYAATTVTVELSTSVGRVVVPDDWSDRVARLPGVDDAGILWEADTGGASVHLGFGGPAAADSTATVFAGSASLGAVVEANLRSGTWFNDFASNEDADVAVVSAAVADRLHLAPVDRHPAIFIGDESFTVVGVYDDVRRDPELELGIVVPYTTAERRWPNAGANAPLLTMRTEPGAAEVIADQAAIALDPQHPEALRVRPIVTLRSLRRTIDDNLVSLFVTLAGVALVVSTFAAASTASLGVMERRPEIGLRRALGASQASIAGQFLLENVLIGFVGGVAGASLGTIVVVVVGAAHHTQAVLDPQVPLYGPLVGLAAGVLAGLLPAMKAARIDPTTAMRSD